MTFSLENRKCSPPFRGGRPPHPGSRACPPRAPPFPPKPPRGRRGGDPPENPPKNKTSPPGCKSNPVKSLREQPSPAPKVGSSRETRLLSQPGLKAFLGAPKPLTISINPKPPQGAPGGRPPREPPQKQNKPSRLQEQPCQKLARAAQPSPKSRFQSRNPAALSTWFKGLFGRTQTLNNFY